MKYNQLYVKSEGTNRGDIMNNSLIKTLKAVNFMSGKTTTDAELKRHRKLAEWAGRLATPKGDVVTRRFKIEKMRCEEITPCFAHNRPQSHTHRYTCYPDRKR